MIIWISTSTCVKSEFTSTSCTSCTNWWAVHNVHGPILRTSALHGHWPKLKEPQTQYFCLHEYSASIDKVEEKNSYFSFLLLFYLYCWKIYILCPSTIFFQTISEYFKHNFTTNFQSVLNWYFGFNTYDLPFPARLFPYLSFFIPSLSTREKSWRFTRNNPPLLETLPTYLSSFTTTLQLYSTVKIWKILTVVTLNIFS